MKKWVQQHQAEFRDLNAHYKQLPPHLKKKQATHWLKQYKEDLPTKVAKRILKIIINFKA